MESSVNKEVITSEDLLNEGNKKKCKLCGKKAAQTKEGYCLVCQMVVDYDPTDILEYWPPGDCVDP